MGEIYPFIMPFIRKRSTIFVERNLNLPLLTLTLNFNSHLRLSAIKIFNLALKIYISYAVDFNKALYNQYDQYFISLRHLYITIVHTFMALVSWLSIEIQQLLYQILLFHRHSLKISF